MERHLSTEGLTPFRPLSRKTTDRLTYRQEKSISHSPDGREAQIEPRCLGRAQCRVRGRVLPVPSHDGRREGALGGLSDPPDLTPHGPAPHTLKRAGAGLRSAGTQRARQRCHCAVPRLAAHQPSAAASRRAHTGLPSGLTTLHNRARRPGRTRRGAGFGILK